MFITVGASLPDRKLFSFIFFDFPVFFIKTDYLSEKHRIL